MKNRPVGQTDRLDEDNSRLSAILQTRLKIGVARPELAMCPHCAHNDNYTFYLLMSL